VDQASTAPLRSSGKPLSAGSVTPITGISREPLLQDLNDLRMDYALSCFKSGEYSRAKELVRRCFHAYRGGSLLIFMFRRLTLTRATIFLLPP
jgi:hypothetical protein